MPSKLKPTYDELEAELLRLRQERRTRLVDAELLLAWMENPKRTRAVSMFKEEAATRLASRIEMLLRGESICPKCGLRKNADIADEPMF